MLRCVIYARYSSDNQSEMSIDAQIDYCTKYAKSNDMVVVDEYKEYAKSATNANRPEFQRMIEDSKKGGFDVVLVYKLDRFCRNRDDSVIYKKKLKDNGVVLRSSRERLDDSIESMILEAVLEVMNEIYSKNLAKEVMTKGHIPNAKGCIHNGGIPPLGLDVNPETQQYKINPEEAVIIKLIFKMYLDGYGYSKIAHTLNQYGYRTKPHVPRGMKGLPKITTEFRGVSIRDILLNEKYIGTYVYNKRSSKDENGRRNNNKPKPDEEVFRTENAFDAIIDKETFQKIQDKLIANKHVGGHFKAKEEYLLAGLIKCAHCGCSMIGNRKFSGRNKRKLLTYRCPHRPVKAEDPCKVKEVRKEYLEDFILTELIQNIFAEKNLPKILDRLNKYHNQKSGTSETSLKSLEYRLAEVNNEILNYKNQLRTGKASDLIMEWIEESNQAKKTIEAEIKLLKTEISIPQISSRDFSALVEYTKENIAKSELKEVKKVIQTFVKEIKTGEDTIEVVFTFSCLMLYGKFLPNVERFLSETSQNINRVFLFGGGEGTCYSNVSIGTDYILNSFPSPPACYGSCNISGLNVP